MQFTHNQDQNNPKSVLLLPLIISVGAFTLRNKGKKTKAQKDLYMNIGILALAIGVSPTLQKYGFKSRPAQSFTLKSGNTQFTLR